MEPPLTSSSTEQVPNSPGGNSNNGGPGSGGEGPIVCNGKSSLLSNSNVMKLITEFPIREY
jgi:hypothetical protein